MVIPARVAVAQRVAGVLAGSVLVSDGCGESRLAGPNTALMPTVSPLTPGWISCSIAAETLNGCIAAAALTGIDTRPNASASR